MSEHRVRSLVSRGVRSLVSRGVGFIVTYTFTVLLYDLLTHSIEKSYFFENIIRFHAAAWV